jgi:hypothetical protein
MGWRASCDDVRGRAQKDGRDTRLERNSAPLAQEPVEVEATSNRLVRAYASARCCEVRELCLPISL